MILLNDLEVIHRHNLTGFMSCNFEDGARFSLLLLMKYLHAMNGVDYGFKSTNDCVKITFITDAVEK